jgi:hypothetical protein
MMWWSNWMEEYGALKERNRRDEEDRRLANARRIWELEHAAKRSATISTAAGRAAFVGAIVKWVWHLLMSHARFKVVG